jgi:iron complex outermembrane receptor protein
MNHSVTAIAGGVLATLTTALVPLPSVAQERARALEEIVVTSQFREQAAQDTPLAITAISGDTLEARSQLTVTDIAAQAPNVTLTQGGAFGGNSLTAYIRGVGQIDFIPAVEPGVGIYVDDVYYASITGAVLELLDLERVEVLRGPQGTLAGKNSIGGAIKLYSKKPSDDLDAFIEAGYGEYDAVRVRGATNFTLVEDSLWGRISGTSFSRDGYIKNLDYGCTHPGQGFPASTQRAGDCVTGTEGGIDYTAARLDSWRLGGAGAARLSGLRRVLGWSGNAKFYYVCGFRRPRLAEPRWDCANRGEFLEGRA